MENQDQQGRSIQDILNSRGQNASFEDKKIRRSRDFDFYGITQGRSGTPETALSIKISKSSGEQFIIEYSDLVSPRKYDGVGKLELSTLSMHITIEGQGLDRLLDYLAEHRLMWIREPESSEDLFTERMEELMEKDLDEGAGEDNQVTIQSIDIRMIN